MMMMKMRSDVINVSPSALKAAIFILVLVFHETSSSMLKCQCQVRNSALTTIGFACRNGPSGSPVCNKAVRTIIPVGYRYFPGLGLYKLHTLSKFYDRGKRTCELEGARMIIPQSDAMVKAIVPIFTPESKVVFSLLGVDDIEKKGVYKGVDGKLAPWLNWLPGEPNGLNGVEHCVEVDAWRAMNDIDCNAPHTFICERKLKAPVPQGYDFINDHGFYKIYREKMAFHEAEAKCQADGGHLAVPETQVEGEALIQHIRTVGDSSPLWVGISDEVSEGQFITVHGTPLEDLDFDNWGTLEPNDGGGFHNEDCVIFEISGALNDDRCSVKHEFICELVIQ